MYNQWFVFSISKAVGSYKLQCTLSAVTMLQLTSVSLERRNILKYLEYGNEVMKILVCNIFSKSCPPRLFHLEYIFASPGGQAN